MSTVYVPSESSLTIAYGVYFSASLISFEYLPLPLNPLNSSYYAKLRNLIEPP
ncbi:hypothetical protein DFH07DRAFT_965857 [Mycena maculata]|uniref:Uncharacterized protein n=1 Tax=Mycena maculata TaxID=230809 RepID=A0AAD7MYV5_9AGAR|nr:hypothetical protein DFH07DRAFT_965857 [Mycena maculata]